VLIVEAVAAVVVVVVTVTVAAVVWGAMVAMVDAMVDVV